MSLRDEHLSRARGHPGGSNPGGIEIKARQPEVILLDLKLPGMDGLALARRLKQDPATKHIPIVAITAAPETFSQSAALAAGCDAYIVKPVDTRKLNAQVMNTAAHQSEPPEKERPHEPPHR
jgi:CheY-like chemotaxis protein